MSQLKTATFLLTWTSNLESVDGSRVMTNPETIGGTIRLRDLDGNYEDCLVLSKENTPFGVSVTVGYTNLKFDQPDQQPFNAPMMLSEPIRKPKIL